MALAINNNLMANNVTRNLQTHYSNLGQSTQRLSSGLRVSSAADDAAGLAVRELMRADIAALNQGVRNANDGISMIQTADGALGVIDSKLIRMKELAEQSATGTYTDSQRTLINQEYQAMAKEITRIAEDTDFNGIKLLNGSDQTLTKETKEAAAGSSNEVINSDGTKTYDAGDFTYTYTSNTGAKTVATYTVAANNYVTINENNGELSGDTPTVSTAVTATYDTTNANVSVEQSTDGGQTWTKVALGTATNAKDVRVSSDFGDGNVQVDEFSSETAMALTVAAGGALTGTVANEVNISSKDNFEIDIHFGSSSAKTDGYKATLTNVTAMALGVGNDAGDNVSSAVAAKNALDNINEAITRKDTVRADLGAVQNRLDATIENISIQKENLQAAESRISDVDVATEMTEFNKQQILANAAVSMLSQANNLPKMAQKLLG